MFLKEFSEYWDLGWVKLKSPSYYLDQFAHGDMVWYEELGLVKDRQLLLPTEPFNDARHLIWVVQSDLLHILHPQSIAPPLFERLLHRFNFFSFSAKSLNSQP